MRTAGYAAYTDQLRLLANDAARGSWGRIHQDVEQALNGQAAQRLRSLVPLQVRRDEGAFFTGGGSISVLGPPEPRQRSRGSTVLGPNVWSWRPIARSDRVLADGRQSG